MNTLSKKKTIVFDLGGVILQWDVALLLGESSPFHSFQKQLSAFLIGKEWTDFDRGKRGYNEIIKCGKTLGMSESLMVEFVDYASDHLIIKENTLKIIKKLKSRGNKLHILSNMNDYTGERLKQKYSFWNYFDTITFSCSTGFVKPEKEIFFFLLKKISASASDILFIDDNAPNIKAANELGIDAILFKTAEQLSLELMEKKI